MKNKIYLLYWLLAFLSVGCYDDKGNNDYRFVNTIEVEPFGQDSYPWAALGDTVRYKPVLHFASGNGDELDLAYEWTFAGKPGMDCRYCSYGTGDPEGNRPGKRIGIQQSEIAPDRFSL